MLSLCVALSFADSLSSKSGFAVLSTIAMPGNEFCVQSLLAPTEVTMCREQVFIFCRFYDLRKVVYTHLLDCFWMARYAAYKLNEAGS